MNAKRTRLLALFSALALLAACKEPAEGQLLGTLEWDRIGLPAEVSEPVLALEVAEGDNVAAGALLLRLDPRRMQARVAQAEAQLAQAKARRDELGQGSRVQTIDAARAEVAHAAAGREEARRQYSRQSELADKQLVARSMLDAARATRDRSEAELAAAQARLQELLAGTRDEQLLQADAALAEAQAALDGLRLSAQRLEIRAPRDGRVDALPFKPGDQPPLGANLASLLVGEGPYARVYVPASQRAQLQPGQKFRLRVQGVAQEFSAHLRSIASQPAFTPYFALTGDDASRLVYRAELVLDEAAARSLPAGLPVQAWPQP